jgi:shikimate kinase
MIPEKIYLTGYMGCGKTTIGKKLSRSLGVSFYDTDILIEERTGLSVAEIFHQRGETYFREQEAGVLDEILSIKNGIVATGGGFPCAEGRMQQLKKNGFVIYLHCSPKFLHSRLYQAVTDRPRLSGLTSMELLEKIISDLSVREVFYRMANLVMEADAKQAEDVHAMLQSLHESG